MDLDDVSALVRSVMSEESDISGGESSDKECKSADELPGIN